MTIAGLSTNISTSGITNDIQIAMLKKNLDTVETAGADIAKMMEASVTPELGQNIDLRIHSFLCTWALYFSKEFLKIQALSYTLRTQQCQQ